jgi:hypothetical protein
MQAKRGASLLLGILVLLGVAAAIWWSTLRKTESDAAQARREAQVVVRVVSGSEKMGLLTDPRFTAAMARQGLSVEARKSGSREIATRPDLASFDVAFPAGQPAAAKIREAATTKGAETALVTPMVIASWRPIARILEANGIVREEGGALWIIDMEKLFALMAEEKRWRDLAGSEGFAVGKSVLVSTTDVRTSNSAAQFLALASYLMNGRNVVTSADTARRLAEGATPLFSKQGFQESSSAGPFEDYLSIGMGKVPLVWIYEAQYLEQALQGHLKPDMVLLYPRPTIFSKHVAVALSDAGLRFAAALRDPEVRAIAADYGYRVDGAEELRRKLEAHKLPLPEIIDVADAPTHDLLEQMILTIENRLAH